MYRPLLSLLTITLASLAMPKPMAPSNVPAARVLANAVANVRAHPDDPDARYAAGRIRFMIFCANDPATIQMYKDVSPFRFAGFYPGPWEMNGAKPRRDAKTVKLVMDAISDLRAAIRLDKGREPGLYHLTLACMVEVAAPIASAVDPKASPGGWRKLAEREYGLAFDAAKPADANQASYGRWISVEAGQEVLRLDPDSPKKKEIQAHLAKMASLPPGPISPIVFSLRESLPLSDLLDVTQKVEFDLDGTGGPQKWPWVKPETAILVWQPDPSVPITSGRQLFGSATWWMMFKDGYAAMAALDNDRNGWLEGKELFGLAVWRDANGNGRSEAGEVVPVRSLGIEGIATRASGRSGRSLVNKLGLRLRDGRVLPTYDWVATPLSP
ncbi:hypothetical protein BH11ARM2_BH11ARM2_25610 [soil metagenome]